MADLMLGNPTLSGISPVRYVFPVTASSARTLLIGINRYFDYGNHENVRKVVRLYFENGYPYEAHLSSISSDLSDLRTMRNSSAHITSTTQAALEALAQRVLGTPWPGVDLYSFLTAADPNIAGNTILVTYKAKLVVAAELIAQG